jgi:hypothetical protein
VARERRRSLTSYRLSLRAAGCAVALALLFGCGPGVRDGDTLVQLNGVEAGGAGVRGLVRMTLVEYTPNRYFGVAFLIRNHSGSAVTITRVSSTDSGRRFVRLVGVKLRPFRPYRCPPGAHCLYQPYGLTSPYRPLPPLHAFVLPAGGEAGVILHFRWVACSHAPPRTEEIDNRTLQVQYRLDSHTRRQTLRTRGAALRVTADAAHVRCPQPGS